MVIIGLAVIHLLEPVHIPKQNVRSKNLSGVSYPKSTVLVFSRVIPMDLYILITTRLLYFSEQESPAIADKPARRESLPKLLQFDVPTTLSLTLLAYLHVFNCYCVRNPHSVARV